MFTFAIGAERQEVTVHASALAGLSPSLNTLINGEMIEAKTRHVVWADVDMDTFIRLCEFAYFRDYTPPTFRLIDGHVADTIPTKVEKVGKKSSTMKEKKKSKVAEDIPLEVPEEVAAVDELEPVPDCPMEVESVPCTPPEGFYDDSVMPYKERSVWTGQLRDAFKESFVVPSLQDDGLDRTFTPPQNTGPEEDFAPVLLEQAQLYVLGDKYGIDSLCQLVLSKLHQTLRSFKLYETGVGGIVELVRFVYENTPPNYGKRLDGLRNLVTRYVVSVLGQIGEDECFQDLLAGGGPFVSDFWHIIWSAEETSAHNVGAWGFVGWAAKTSKK